MKTEDIKKEIAILEASVNSRQKKIGRAFAKTNGRGLKRLKKLLNKKDGGRVKIVSEGHESQVESTFGLKLGNDVLRLIELKRKLDERQQ